MSLRIAWRKGVSFVIEKISHSLILWTACVFFICCLYKFLGLGSVSLPYFVLNVAGKSDNPIISLTIIIIASVVGCLIYGDGSQSSYSLLSPYVGFELWTWFCLQCTCVCVSYISFDKIKKCATIFCFAKCPCKLSDGGRLFFHFRRIE